MRKMVIMMNIWTLYKLPPRLRSGVRGRWRGWARAPCSAIIQYRVPDDLQSSSLVCHTPRPRSWRKNKIENQIWIFSGFLTLENIFSFRPTEEVTRLMDKKMEFLQN